LKINVIRFNLEVLSNIFFVFVYLGVGVGMVMVSAIVCVYYNVIIGWTLYYLFMSFRTVLPWSTCGNEWNTPYCVDDSMRNAAVNSTIGNYSHLNNISQIIFVNSTHTFFNGSFILETAKKSASEEYWT